MEAAGMEVREDGLTNLSGILRAKESKVERPRIHVGSHYDTVVNAGAFDGTLGVLIGLAVAEALKDANYPLGHDVFTHAFCDEEGVRFQTTFLGSAALSGQFDRAWLGVADSAGKSLGDWLKDRGVEVEALLSAEPLIRPQDRFLEAHIEQGPVLESMDLPLGVFGRIAAQMRAEVRLRGAAGHAGTTPARLRSDPLPVACAMVEEVAALCRSDESVRATVGSFHVSPNAPNVIPGEVRFSIDLRRPRLSELEASKERLFQALREIHETRGGGRLELSIQELHQAADVRCDPGLTRILCEQSEKHQGKAVELFSGAGHDSMKIAAVCPVGLLAVRCRDGLSHHPDEFSSAEDCIAAMRTMLDTVVQIDRILCSEEKETLTKAQRDKG
jgi:allantoate deiminase